MVVICVTVLGFFLITFVVHKFNQILLTIVDLRDEVNVLKELIKKQHGKRQKTKEGEETKEG
jgi:hypothetical protein